MKEDQQDIVIIRVGSNDIMHNTINDIDAKGISKCILDIGEKCLLYGVKEVIIYFSNLLRSSGKSVDLLGSSGKSVITYVMNAVVTNFISLKR